MKTENRKNPLLKGTCEWVREDPAYRAWVNSRSSRILWIHGDPGKGKTMIVLSLLEAFSTIADSLDDSAGQLVYFLCDSTDNTRNTVLSMAKSLLYQILSQQPRMLIYCRRRFEIQREWLFSSLEGVWGILQDVLVRLPFEEIYVLLDALDECKPHALSTFLRLLTSFDVPDKGGNHSDSSCRVKILLTSRNENRFKEHLGGLLNIDLGLNFDLVAKDVDKFVASEVADLATRKGYDDTLRKEVDETLRQKADGTFLWVALACSELRERTMRFNTRKCLEQLPSGLVEMYQRMLEELESQSDLEIRAYAKEMLRSIAVALRPLTIEELAIAADLPGEMCEDTDDLINNIIKQCGSLIIFEDNTVHLVHQSAKDFLKSEAHGILSTNLIEENCNLAMRCLRYVSSCTFSGLPIEETDPFSNPEVFQESLGYLEYPVIYWMEHAKAASSKVNTHIDINDEFFRPDSKLRQSWFNLYWPMRHSLEPQPHGFTLLHLAAYAGWSWMAGKLIGNNGSESVNIIDSLGMRPLHWAAKWGWIDVVEILLTNGADAIAKDHEGEPAITYAAEGGHITLVQLLLRHLAHVESPEKYGDALERASADGHAEIVKFLLDNGADINHHRLRRDKAPDTSSIPILRSRLVTDYLDRGPALVAASESNQEKIVQLLLEKGADPNIQGGASFNALHAASTYGSEAIVKMLLQSGAKVNAPGGHWGNALQAASYHGYLPIVETLLMNGADVNAQGGRHHNALEAAACGNKTDVARLLLAFGADVNAQVEEEFGQSGNALQWALRNGNAELMKLLLDNGADVDPSSSQYKDMKAAASKSGNPQVISMLLQKAKEAGGSAEEAEQNIASEPLPIEQDDEVSRLLQEGTELNAQDMNNLKGLLESVSANFQSIFKLSNES